MKEKINSSFNKNKKDDNNIINPIYSTNNLSKKISENKTNQNQNNFLGKKRKNFNNSKKFKKHQLSISKSITHSINNTNNNSICSICYENISFETKHYCHCGHHFHCCCINKWIKTGKNNCPICRENIDCSQNQSIELEEEESENNYINNNINRNIYTNRIKCLYEYICLLIAYILFKYRYVKYIFICNFLYEFYNAWFKDTH